jgi:hypothetical protein
MVTQKKASSLLQYPFNITSTFLQPATGICPFVIPAVIFCHCIFLNYKGFVSDLQIY